MARGADSPTAPRALRREATREALVRAAHRLAKRPGAECLDPTQVAAEAGVSRPLFYAHFPGRADFVEALLASVHAGPDAARSRPLPHPPAKEPAPETGRAALLRLFEGLAEPLDRHAALVRALIPASHQPGPVAEVRARRRERAIVAVLDRLPGGLPDRAARAAFLMDAFLGLQLAWSKAAAGVYFYRLDASQGTRARKMIFLR